MADIRHEARRAVLAHHHLDHSQAVAIVGREALADTSAVVSYDRSGIRRYPRFQFDTEASAVRPIVAEINRVLGADCDPWGVASWWLSPSAWRADGRSPASLAEEGSHDAELHAMAADLLDS